MSNTAMYCAWVFPPLRRTRGSSCDAELMVTCAPEDALLSDPNLLLVEVSEATKNLLLCCVVSSTRDNWGVTRDMARERQATIPGPEEFRNPGRREQIRFDQWRPLTTCLPGLCRGRRTARATSLRHGTTHGQ